jgi:hypothetical protein
MKTLITVILALFLSPVAAQSFGLYEKSGGYETSGGYERSGGYEKSDGYERSEGYDTSQEGYEASKEGYQRFEVDNPDHTKRMTEEAYDEQMNKASSKKGKWIANRHADNLVMPELRNSLQTSGGVENPADE